MPTTIPALVVNTVTNASAAAPGAGLLPCTRAANRRTRRPATHHIHPAKRTPTKPGAYQMSPPRTAGRIRSDATDVTASDKAVLRHARQARSACTPGGVFVAFTAG